jgi:hypothetical protein
MVVASGGKCRSVLSEGIGRLTGSAIALIASVRRREKLKQ